MIKKQAVFCASNWNKKTPLFWKRLGDVCIYSLPLWQGLIMKSPLSPEAREWAEFIVGFILVLTKMLTKFFAEEPKE